ncbi:MAG: bifunctional oligoribonuclease/PAP phosphatase NrnA [bacterium]
MVSAASLEKVKDCIRRGNRFVLTTHVNPDGDGLGSEAAMAAFLNELGKDVYIFNSGPVPANYRFLDSSNKMIVYKPHLHREILFSADYIIILDISDWNRLRKIGEDMRDLKTKKICIDHHPPMEKFGDINLINIEACSTGEIVYDLIKFCCAPISKTIAEALYTCIVTDTGSFKFSNTNARAYTISGELVEAGVNPQKIYQQIYEHQTKSKIKLFAYVLNNLHFEQNDRVVWVEVTQKVLEEIGAKSYETDGLADYPRVINGVEVSIMFIEKQKSRIKVSLRSSGNFVINGIAQKFGGGGHPFAAGVSIEGSLKEYRPKILEEVSYLFRR